MSDFSGGKGDHMIKLSEDDEEGWVDTHHGVQDEQGAVADMSMGSEDTDVGKKGIYAVEVFENNLFVCHYCGGDNYTI